MEKQKFFLVVSSVSVVTLVLLILLILDGGGKINCMKKKHKCGHFSWLAEKQIITPIFIYIDFRKVTPESSSYLFVYS